MLVKNDITLATTDSTQDFFVRSVKLQDAANAGGVYLQEFLNKWSTYIDLDKSNGNYERIMNLICSMIHTTESELPIKEDDIKRLEPLALQIHCRFLTMRGAFTELINK